MLIPEAFLGRPELAQEVRDFYAYHSSLVEPWDGPAAVAFTDGRVIGATLDRNGLRPGRWVVTRDGWVVMASETGVLDSAEGEIVAKGRLRPGKLFLVDLERDRIVPDDELKAELARRKPYGEWLHDRVVHIEDLPEKSPRVPRVEPLRAKQLAFGWTEEDLRIILAPMARDAAEPTGSMGNDVALASLSDRRPPLFSYFKQLFAQVTNPAIDPIRESVVMSLEACIGPEINLLGETPDHCHQLVMAQPILRNSQLEKLRQVDHNVFEARTIDMTWCAEEGEAGMQRRIDDMCREASELVARGVNIIILSDRNMGPERAAMPSLLAVGAVHHHLVREGTRLQIGLVVETGEAREIHHIATLIGFGAAAINPYVMFECVYALHREGRLPEGMSPEEAEQRVIKAIGKGLLKVLSKMGISTVRSYTGAQIFEAVGVKKEVVDRHFTGTTSRVEGVGLDTIAREALDRHSRAYPAAISELLPAGGIYQWRRRGEYHGWNPETIATLQGAARGENGAQDYERFATYVNDVAVRNTALRGLLRFRDDVEPVELDEVEPAVEIVRRFKSGGMSLGALSPEAHETLAAGMNRLGGKSNTGEGGEDPRALPRRAPLGDQAGGLRALRRDGELPRQRRRAPDQGGPGRQARRGRPAPRPQGRPLHRRPAPLDTRRGADLAPAASRHLLDRGPQAAHLRPALRQPAGAHLGEARVGDRRGHGGRGRGQGERRPRGDRRPRRRHRRLARRPRSITPASPGRSAWPRPSRRCCATTCARASWWRSTARCAPAATWRSARSWAPTSSASPPRR